MLLMVFQLDCFAGKYFFKGRSGIAFLYPPVLPKPVAPSTTDPVPSFTGSTEYLCAVLGGCDRDSAGADPALVELGDRNAARGSSSVPLSVFLDLSAAGLTPYF